MSRVVYPARETVTEIRGEDAAEIINKMMEKEGEIPCAYKFYDQHGMILERLTK